MMFVGESQRSRKIKSLHFHAENMQMFANAKRIKNVFIAIDRNCQVVYRKAEWTPFQTQYFSENLAVPRIEPGSLDL
jgi:hypothetical protein